MTIAVDLGRKATKPTNQQTQSDYHSNLAIVNLLPAIHDHCHLLPYLYTKGAQWISGRVLDLRLKGCGFETHRRHCVVVIEQDTFILVHLS